MIEKDNPDLSINKQCKLIGVCRATFYYKPRPVSELDLKFMTKIDAQYLKTPFYGYRRMTVFLQREGFRIGFKRVRRLMRLMGIEAIYRKPKTTISNPEHKTYPYLLKDLAIEKPNQVWATDITYIPMKYGFLYLVVVMDWISRYVLSWKLSNTLEAGFCCETLQEALLQYEKPDIHNSDQGSQYTSQEYTKILMVHNIQISMDGRGRYMDNIFVERLWRSVKYEEVYLKAYETVAEAKRQIGAYFKFYNEERPHSSLGYKTPKEIYFGLKSPDGFMDNPKGLPTTPQGQQPTDLLKERNELYVI
jgi:putative transposase